MTDLFPYQETGACWLASKRCAMLADTMGLGKSAQAIRACDLVYDAPVVKGYTARQTVVVVCPAGVRENWIREFQKFSYLPRKAFVTAARGDAPVKHAVNVVSYEGAVRNQKAIAALEPDVLVLDEAHYLKSPSAKRTQAIFGHKGQKGIAHSAQRVWALTGTPMPNNPLELFPILKTLFPAALAKKSGGTMTHFEFMYNFCKVVSSGFGTGRPVGGKNLDKLAKRIEPFVLRRTKEEVLKDLPPIRFTDLYLPARLSWANAPKYGEMIDLIEAALTSNDPGEALDKLMLHVSQLRRAIGLAKVPALTEWLTEAFEIGALEKVVVFAHHTDVLGGLREGLQEALGVGAVVTVEGSTAAGKRDEHVQRFQNDPTCKVFLGQIQAAGTGITLTAASDLIFAEHSWVPAENEQAAMRIHRIGQKDSCLVRYAIIPNSLDEKIAAVVRKKQQTIKQVFA